MANNLETRITALERNAVYVVRKVFRIVCKGATPTPEEQAQINDARADGANLFIIRLIVSHPKTNH